MLLPAGVLVIGFLAAISFQRPRHLMPPAPEQVAAPEPL
jgi:hypothetical protein